MTAKNVKKCAKISFATKIHIGAVLGCMLLICTVGFYVYRSITPDKTLKQRAQEYREVLKNGAISATHSLIEQHLENPITARHPEPDDHDEYATINGSNLFTVHSWVIINDSPEARKYTAKVKYFPPTDTWGLLNIEFDQPE